jgi:hypothetical protein
VKRRSGLNPSDSRPRFNSRMYVRATVTHKVKEKRDLRRI